MDEFVMILVAKYLLVNDIRVTNSWSDRTYFFYLHFLVLSLYM